MLATKLREIKKLNLAGQGVRAAELYYHKSCHVSFKKDMAEQSGMKEAMIRIQRLKNLWL